MIGELLMNNLDRKLSAVLVDDEPLARQLLQEMIEEAHPDIHIIEQCADGFEAVKAITDLSPDLVFLDICMPKLDGFEVLELLTIQPAVIFVTAYDEHALKAFDAHAIDYLLKPFSEQRLAMAIDKVRKQHIHTPSNATKQTSFDDEVSEDPVFRAQQLALDVRSEAKGHLERIVIKEGRQIQIIPVTQIDYISAADDYVSIHSQGKAYLKHQTLGSLEKALNPEHFIRIHRSHILRFERLAQIEPYSKDQYTAVLHDQTRLNISRSGYKKLKHFLEL